MPCNNNNEESLVSFVFDSRVAEGVRACTSASHLSTRRDATRRDARWAEDVRQRKGTKRSASGKERRKKREQLTLAACHCCPRTERGHFKYSFKTEKNNRPKWKIKGKAEERGNSFLKLFLIYESLSAEARLEKLLTTSFGRSRFQSYKKKHLYLLNYLKNFYWINERFWFIVAIAFLLL